MAASRSRKPARRDRATDGVRPRPGGRRARPVLLAGGNPQVAKADGDAPVQAWIEGLPGWKRDAAARLDALVERTVPGVRKAVRWNSPFYGVEGRGWFLGVHGLTRYLKLAFFAGSSLRPPPPVASKNAGTRYAHLFEHERPDDGLLARWIRQAARLRGTDCF